MEPVGQHPDGKKSNDSNAHADSRWPSCAPTKRPRDLDPWTAARAFRDGLKLCEETSGLNADQLWGRHGNFT